ncbi:MAG: type II secretion system F family protein [Hyphomicrobium sp.]
MPKFDFTAFDSAGRRIAGRIDADSSEAALQKLNRQGHFPIAVTEHASGAAQARESNSSTLFYRGPSDNEVTLFTQELALLLAAGQPLSRAMALIADDAGAPRIAALARRLRGAIAGGRSLNEALAMEGRSFPPIYIGMVKAAEAAGMLESTLTRIAETREREQRLQSKVLSALLYPALLVVMAIGVVIIMFTVVIPQFRSMLGERSGNLPEATQFVITASDWLTENGETLGIGFVALLICLLLLGRTTAFQIQTERLLFALPLVGSIMRLALTARFCRTLGILLDSGLGLPAALSLTREIIGNRRASDLIGQIGVALREGKDFSDAFRQSPIFPPMVTSLLRIGAESGSLGPSSLRLAGMYETKLEIAIQRLVTILEPAIILFVAVFIGFIVLTIMSAIMGVYDLTGV